MRRSAYRTYLFRVLAEPADSATVCPPRRSRPRWRVAPVANRSNNLPAHLPSLIGRDEAVQSVSSSLLEPGRGVLTLTGTGGCGKTCLALAVATGVLEWVGFPDGIWLVELAPVGDPLLVAGVVAASMGIKELSGRPIRDTLLEELRSRSLLVVLDNCE